MNLIRGFVMPALGRTARESVSDLTPHERLLLECARVVPSDDDNGRLEEIIRFGGVDWREFVEGAIRHGIAQIAARRIAQADVRSEIPGKVTACLDRLLAGNRERNRIMLRECSRLIRALDGAGIRSVLLKGPALALTIYPESALRNYADLDILVDPDRLSDAALVAATCGFGREDGFDRTCLHLNCAAYCPEDILSDTLAPEFVEDHSAAKVSKFRHRILAELHGGLFRTPDGSARHADIEAFWQSARQITLPDGTAARVLSPESAVVHLAAHAEGHLYRRLVFAVDIALVTQAAGRDFDWQRLQEHACRLSVDGAVFKMLDFSSRICGAPTGWSEACPRLTQVDAPLKLVDVVRPLSGGRSEVALRRVVGASGAAEKIRATVRILFPPVEVIRRVYRVRNPLLVGIAAAFRPIHILFRVARVLARGATNRTHAYSGARCAPPASYS